jgi:uncharacterized membrane protein
MTNLQAASILERITVTGAVYILLAVALLTVTVLVPSAGIFDTPQVRSDTGSTYKARVISVLDETTRSTPAGEEFYQRLEVEVDGRRVEVEQTSVAGFSRHLDVGAGDAVLVTATQTPNGEAFRLADHGRDFPLWTLGLAFAALVVFIGRWRGLASLVGMAASLLVILRFIIPGIVSGHDPVTISVIGSVVIMASSLFLAHGVNSKTAAALVATTVALTATALLAAFAVRFARLSGLAEEHANTLNILTRGEINPEGLLLGGMIIGALGVLDDVTVAQASSAFEIRAANPLLNARQVFARAMNIGRDHIASTVNTLFLAYSGAALPLLIILSLQTESASVLLNREFLATEVVRTLVGSIGIVASVPLTTALAAVVCTRIGPAATGTEAHGEPARVTG